MPDRDLTRYQLALSAAEPASISRSVKAFHCLAAGLFLVAVSCERHEWEETKALHEHGSHGHDDHGHDDHASDEHDHEDLSEESGAH